MCDTLENNQPTNFNDAKCDPRGRLVAGLRSLWRSDSDQPQLPDGGSLVGFKDEQSVTTLAPSGYSLSNGLAWTSDGATLFFVDSKPARRVYAFDYELGDNFAIDRRRTAIDFSDLNLHGEPDGIAMDSNNRLWVACYGASCVLCFDLHEGGSRIFDKVILPTPRVTSCCFGGPNLSNLFVTTARESEFDDQLAGSVFKVSNVNAMGVPVSLFS